MRRARAAVLVAACVVGMVSGCGGDADGDAGAEREKPRSNGIRKMTPEAAVFAAYKENRDRADIVFEGKVALRLPVGERVYRATISVAPRECSVEARSRDLGDTDFRYIDHTVYFRPSERAWLETFESTATAVELYRGKWLTFPPDDPQFESICNPHGVWSSFIDKSSCRWDGRGRVAGTRTAVLKCRAGDDAQRLEVASVGAPLLLRVSGRTFFGPYDLRVTDTDTGLEVRRPPARALVDLGEFDR